VPDTTAAFDLPAYLARIGELRPARADIEALRALHRAHLAAIPFENLDIQMGLPIDLDLASLQNALVGRRRGGYCFQQNALFRFALEALGFAVRPLEARVRWNAGGATRPRTHMVLAVVVDGTEWLADVGFGGDGIVEPIGLDGTVGVQDGWAFRVSRDGRLRVLQRKETDGWGDLYAFSEEAAEPIDYVVGNWYTSTHPDSTFVQTLTVQRMVGGTRHILRNLSYGVATAGERFHIRPVTRLELVPLLRDVFGLDLPDEVVLKAIDRDAARSIAISSPYSSRSS
jgi:N-hydroxyarylamine O-acetyltransferase